MKNITLAVDEETLAAGRAYAERHHTTLNALVRDETKIYPNMRILEWNEAAGDRTYLFGKDKLHLSGTGGRYYSDLIVWSLAQAGYVGTAPAATSATNVATSPPQAPTSATATSAAPTTSVRSERPASPRAVG